MRQRRCWWRVYFVSVAQVYLWTMQAYRGLFMDKIPGLAWTRVRADVPDVQGGFPKNKTGAGVPFTPAS